MRNIAIVPFLLIPVYLLFAENLPMGELGQGATASHADVWLIALVAFLVFFFFYFELGEGIFKRFKADHLSIPFEYEDLTTRERVKGRIDEIKGHKIFFLTENFHPPGSVLTLEQDFFHCKKLKNPARVTVVRTRPTKDPDCPWRVKAEFSRWGKGKNDFNLVVGGFIEDKKKEIKKR